jgi:hypothetical protein
MTEKITTKKAFKPVLLFIDEMSKARLTKMYIDSLELTNIAILEASNIGEKKLTRKGIQSLIDNPQEFAKNLKEVIKETFQFPNATDEFNLSALGINYTNFDNAIGKLQPTEYIYLITDEGKLQPEPKQLELIEGNCTIYSTNERQNKALKVAKDMQKAANTLLDLKITYSDTQHHLGKCTNQLVRWGSNSTIQIDYHKIRTF